MLNALILTALSVVPVYTNHNRVAGNVQTMTNMQAWAHAVEMAIENSGTDTNAVSDIITNHVTSGYLCTSNAAVALAGAAEAKAKAASRPNTWMPTAGEVGAVSSSGGEYNASDYTFRYIFAAYVETANIHSYAISAAYDCKIGWGVSQYDPETYFSYTQGEARPNLYVNNVSIGPLAVLGDIPDAYTKTDADVSATNIAQSVLKNAVENEYVGISIMTNFLPITGGGYDWSSYRFEDAKTKYGAFRFLLIPKGSSEPAAVFDASGAYVDGNHQVRFNSSPATFGVKMLNVVEGKVALTTDIQDVAAPIATNIVKDATNSLATVAHSGDYDDLSGRPNIPVISTNAAEAVVGDHLYYASTNLADNVELRLFSGEWVNAEYDGVGTADVVLDLTGVPTDKVTDTLMVLNCAATGTLNVATSVNACRVIHKKDAKVHELKAGINLLTFSRFRMENGTNFVLVTNNELE